MKRIKTPIRWGQIAPLVCLLWLLAPGQAIAQAPPGQQVGIKSQAGKSQWWRNFYVSGTLGTNLGSGSFAPSDTYKNHFVSQSMQLIAGYNIWNGLFAEARWGFDLEYTQPDNSAGRRFFSRDTTLSMGWRNPIPGMKKVVWHMFRLNFQMPTSPQAQVSTRLLRLNFGSTFAYTIARVVTVGYIFGVAKDFHRYTSPLFDQSGAVTPSVLLRQSARGDLDLSDGLAPIPGTRNVSWQLRNMLFASVNFHKTLSLNITFGIFNAFKYAMPDDQLTPTIPTSGGDVRADTVGRIDLTMGDINLQWRPVRYLQVALGALSFQSPLTNNNAGLRVPFFNLATPNDNTTTFYLNVTGMY